MKKITLIATLIIFFSLNSIAQTIQFKKMSKAEILDSICNYMMVANSLSMEPCDPDRFGFDIQKRWEVFFPYRGIVYEHKYISKESENIYVREDYNKIVIDTNNFSIHFPYQDAGGSGKASGCCTEQFSFLNFKKMKSISWNIMNKELILVVYSENGTIGSYNYTGCSNSINRKTSAIFIHFIKEKLPAKFKEKVEMYFQLLNQ